MWKSEGIVLQGDDGNKDDSKKNHLQVSEDGISIDSRCCLLTTTPFHTIRNNPVLPGL
jgi:hypothetical protein